MAFLLELKESFKKKHKAISLARLNLLISGHLFNLGPNEIIGNGVRPGYLIIKE